MSKTYNGRVDIKTPDTNILFSMQDKIPVVQPVGFRNPLVGVWDETLLSKVYFSVENMGILQNGIRAGVYNASKKQYMIGVQDYDTLKIIMRSVYLQHASHQQTNITRQVEQLNKLVIDYCVKQIYGEAQGYLKYVDDASTLVVPMAHPVLTNVGDKQLEQKSWF
jgi:hypothetical protein